MAPQTILYDAFTGISPLEKNAVISFLCKNTSDNEKNNIKEAVEYAVKLKPSFGGFILTAQQNKNIIAAIVANKTGMEGYNAKHLFVYIVLAEEFQQAKEMVQKLLKRAISHADGEIALHVKPNNPSIQLYQNLGFSDQYLELRLDKSKLSTRA